MRVYNPDEYNQSTPMWLRIVALLLLLPFSPVIALVLLPIWGYARFFSRPKIRLFK